jgi:suppressor of ftsI
MRFVIAAIAVLPILSACTDSDAPAEATTVRTPFEAGIEGLPEAVPAEALDLHDGDTVKMRVGYVVKTVAGRKVRMLAYNGSIPGPTLKLLQGARITLLLTNETGLPTTLHPHGVRVDNAFDGATGVTQAAIDSGATFAYQLHFPDAGLYWYHPHYREDYQQALGLYGNFLVAPADSAPLPAVHREVFLMLGDLLLDEDGIHDYYRDGADHVMMGRFGNVLLVNGDTVPTLRIKRNEMIRFYVTNVAGSRVFNLRFTEDVGMNVIGGDNGLFRTPAMAEQALIAPSERLIIDAWMHDPLEAWDTLELRHQTPARDFVLARFVYDTAEAEPDLQGSLSELENPAVAGEIAAYRRYFDKAPDKEIVLTSEMDMSMPPLKKIAVAEDDPNAGAMGIEWTDNMGEMNSGSSRHNMRWIIRDKATGLENHAINWVFHRGEAVLIRVVNDPVGMHPMPHPLHFHGQRFLVVRENGKAPPWDMGWKDTYLIGRGYTVDLLLDASNPGDWMFHCHIPEHMESDMMAHFRVE